VLPTAPSTYHDHVAKRRDPARLSIQAKQDEALKVEVRRVFEENFRLYDVRKVWRQLRREGFDIARYTVSRLMRQMGLEGTIRGKAIRTTVQDKAAACPLDHANRGFHAPAPNTLWLSDFTYVSTWSGFVYVAFDIDAYARRIVGWRVSRTAHAGFVLDALEQALHERRPHTEPVWCFIRTEVLNTSRSSTPSAWPKRASSLPSEASAILRQCARRNDQRPLQGRGHPSTRPVALLRSGRVRHARMGRLVQQSPAVGAHRQHPADGSRGTLLRHAGTAGHGSVTQTKRPPANPARFRVGLSGAVFTKEVVVLQLQSASGRAI